jgi:hypothetical protein
MYAKQGTTNENGLSRATLDRFVNDKRTGVKYRRAVGLSALYDYLLAHERYREYFDPEEVEQPATPEPVALSVERGLSDALGRLLLSEAAVEHRTMKAIQACFPGRYVMYRADLRPYAYKVEAAARYRASAVTITLSDGAVCIEEVQDYPPGKDHDALAITTTGILFPYGRYVMFMVRALEQESLRLGVIDREYSFVAGKGLGWFSGVILVASKADLFPSTRFMCVRDDGSLKTGLVFLQDIPNLEAQAYLRGEHEKAKIHYK